MPQGCPKEGELYRHFKDKMYQIVTIATHSETREAMVVYQALYGDYRVYVRPYDMFISEVDHVKYPDVRETYRFTLVEKEKGIEGVDWSDKTVTASDTEAVGVNPKFLAFLDTDDLDEKYEILCSLEADELTDKLIDDFAVTMDVVIPESSDIDGRYAQLKRALGTRIRFEQTRLR